MKKLNLLLVSIVLLSVVFTGCKKEKEEVKKDETPKPQVAVEKINNSLTQKVTGTRCPPCGSWGWSMMDELMTYGQGKSFFISTYSQNFVAEGFITQTATDMGLKWGITGYPTFVTNGKPMLSRPPGSVNTSAEKQMCKDEIDAHRSKEVVANIGLEKTIDGNTINIKTSTQFFTNTSGDYKIALYVVENDAKWKQSGHPQGASAIPHHYVLRGAVNGTWGENISTGDVSNGKFFDKDFTYTAEANWDKSKISIIAVLWKVDGSNYVYVNSNSSK